MLSGSNPFLRFGLALSTLALPVAAGAAKLVEGTFLATRECPAYVSKARQTNPDEAKLVPGRTYELFEINQDATPDYYRIRIEGANPVERWVAAECGEYPPKSSPAAFTATSEAPSANTLQCDAAAAGRDACRTCGKADAYVLSLQWHPGLCETQRGHKDLPPGCLNADSFGYAARNFTFRALSPVQRRCKREYAFCGAVEREMKSLNAYPPVNLSETGRQALNQIMPGVAENTGLERLAWHKHGTCTGFPEEAYFKLAGDLTRQFNQYGMGNFMAENLGKKIRREEFFQQIEASLGAGARRHINIECSTDTRMLTGVVINLPGGIAPGADLKSLVQQAPRTGSAGNCGSRILIDAAGRQ